MHTAPIIKPTTDLFIASLWSAPLLRMQRKMPSAMPLSQAVGTLVDSETRVTQDKVLEEILTASNAYIEKHKVLSQKQEEGLWHVSMEATVEYKALQMRLEVSTPTTNMPSLKTTKKVSNITSQAFNESLERSAVLFTGVATGCWAGSIRSLRCAPFPAFIKLFSNI